MNDPATANVIVPEPVNVWMYVPGPLMFTGKPTELPGALLVTWSVTRPLLSVNVIDTGLTTLNVYGPLPVAYPWLVCV